MDIFSTAGESAWALHRQGSPASWDSWQQVPPHPRNRSDCNRALNERRGVIKTCLYCPLPGPCSPGTARRAGATGPPAPAAPGLPRPEAPTGAPVSSGRTMPAKMRGGRGWKIVGPGGHGGVGWGGEGRGRDTRKGALGEGRRGGGGGGDNELRHTDAGRSQLQLSLSGSPCSYVQSISPCAANHAYGPCQGRTHA